MAWFKFKRALHTKKLGPLDAVKLYHKVKNESYLYLVISGQHKSGSQLCALEWNFKKNAPISHFTHTGVLIQKT